MEIKTVKFNSELKSYFYEARANAKKIPLTVYVLASILPFGFMLVTAHLAYKSYKSQKAEVEK